MKKARWLLGALVSLAFSLGSLSCLSYVAPGNPARAAERLFERKLAALKATDHDAYMETVSAADPYYMKEAEAWFWYTVNHPFEDLAFTVEAAELRPNGAIVARVRQSHACRGQGFSFAFQQVVRKEGGRWVDADLAWETLDTGAFVIRYMPGEGKLDAFRRYLLKAADEVAMTDEREVMAYYGTSGLIVLCMEELYGPDVHLRILEELGRNPWFDRMRYADPEPLVRPLLHEAFMNTLGLGVERISADYLAWLERRFPR